MHPPGLSWRNKTSYPPRRGIRSRLRKKRMVSFMAESLAETDRRGSGALDDADLSTPGFTLARADPHPTLADGLLDTHHLKGHGYSFQDDSEVIPCGWV